jgi:branched-chain amino acid transport system permease protein
VIFGIPSLRIKGLYLAVATLAAQFFVDWAFLRDPLVHPRHALRLGQRRRAERVRLPIESPAQKYVFCLAFLLVFGVLGQEPRARRTSAASGWRSATWTSPPR